LNQYSSEFALRRSESGCDGSEEQDGSSQESARCEEY
jgi:hypothetical protein